MEEMAEEFFGLIKISIAPSARLSGRIPAPALAWWRWRFRKNESNRRHIDEINRPFPPWLRPD